MSHVWVEYGFFVPVTLVDVSTNVVTAVKSEESDGYKAVQLGYGQVDPTKVTKPLAGHFAKAGVEPVRFLDRAVFESLTGYRRTKAQKTLKRLTEEGLLQKQGHISAPYYILTEKGMDSLEKQSAK